MSRIIAAAEDAADLRRRMGVAALDRDAASDGSWQARWRDTVAARLPCLRWPERAVLITAVNAHTGEPVVFDRDSRVDLVDAFAASCAGGPAYAIGDRRYIDGGYRSMSTDYVRAAAESRRPSRTTRPSACSARIRWTCRFVRPPPGPATTRAGRSP